MNMKDNTVHEKGILYERILRDILGNHVPNVNGQTKMKKGFGLVQPEGKMIEVGKWKHEDKQLISGKEEDQNKFKESRMQYTKSCIQHRPNTQEVVKCEGH